MADEADLAADAVDSPEAGEEDLAIGAEVFPAERDLPLEEGGMIVAEKEAAVPISQPVG